MPLQSAMLSGLQALPCAARCAPRGEYSPKYRALRMQPGLDNQHIQARMAWD